MRYFLKSTRTSDLLRVAYSFTHMSTAPPNVQVHKWVVASDGIWNEQSPHHDDYANGHYPVTQARTFWDELIEQGYIPVEKL